MTRMALAALKLVMLAKRLAEVRRLAADKDVIFVENLLTRENPVLQQQTYSETALTFYYDPLILIAKVRLTSTQTSSSRINHVRKFHGKT